jgi:hypothetical protein
MWDVIFRYNRNATDPMEIDLIDPSYLSDHYVTKIPSWLANIYTGLTKQMTAIEKLVWESPSMDRLATTTCPSLIVQYRPRLEQPDAIYKLAQENKFQFERMSYN